MEGGVQLGPLGTAATNRPTVPTPGDYEDGEIGGMMIGRENLPQCRYVDHKPHMLCPHANPGRRGGKPSTNRLSYGTAFSEMIPRSLGYIQLSAELCGRLTSLSG
jgi:hypothetical protein